MLDNTSIGAETWLPRYKQIATGIKTYIKENRLLSGSKLPGGRYFAHLFNASKNTVYEALEFLQSEGIIDIRPDSGCYVAYEAWIDFIQGSPNWNDYICGGWQQTGGTIFHDLYRGASDKSNIYLSLASLDKSFGYYNVIKNVFQEILPTIENSISLNDYDVQGHLSFRQVIAGRLQRRGIEAQVSNIAVTWGIMGSVDLLIKALLGRGDTIYVATASFASTLTAASSIGINIINIDFDDEGVNIEKFKKVVRKSKRSIFITSPNCNGATGIIMSPKRREELMDFCQQADIVIIEIDGISDTMPPSYKSLKSIDRHNRVIYIDTIFLPYSIGMDISWIVMPDYLIDHIVGISSQVCHHPFNLNNLIVEKMFSNRSYNIFIKELKPKMKQRTMFLDKLLIRHMADIATWDKSYIRQSFWIKMDDKINVRKMIKNRNSGVVFAGGEFFDKRYSQYIAITSFSLSDKKLEEGIIRLSLLARASID